MPQILL